jgi:hypothetical protein
MEDCLAHPHKPLTWLITPGQAGTTSHGNGDDAPCDYRHTVQCGACEAGHQQTAVTDQMGAAGQSLHLSFGSSATFKLGVVVEAWGGLWSYYTSATRSNSVFWRK